jgi:hypothetical protein
VLTSLRDELNKAAPHAYLAPPQFPPAVAAARMAHDHLNQIALAV